MLWIQLLINLHCKIVNMSLESGIVPDAFKKAKAKAVVKPLLKKSTFDPNA